MRQEIAPLELNLWFARIELIARGGLGSIQNSLRHAAHLSQLTPVSFRSATNFALNEADFEALLDADDFDTAARHLVHSVQLCLREHGNITAEAWINCPILGTVIYGGGGTVAVAVLDAWTKRLLALREACGAESDNAVAAARECKAARGSIRRIQARRLPQR